MTTLLTLTRKQEMKNELRARMAQSFNLQPPGPEFFAAYHGFQGDVPGIGKDRRDEKGRVFASHESFLEAVLPIANKHGLLIMEGESDISTPPEGLAEDGAGEFALMADAWVMVAFVVIHAPTGSGIVLVIESPVLVHKGMKVDKAVKAALSYLLLYALRGMSMAPRVIEEPTIDDRNDEAALRGRGPAKGPRAARPQQLKILNAYVKEVQDPEVFATALGLPPVESREYQHWKLLTDRVQQDRASRAATALGLPPADAVDEVPPADAVDDVPPADAVDDVVELDEAFEAFGLLGEKHQTIIRMVQQTGDLSSYEESMPPREERTTEQWQQIAESIAADSEDV